MRGQMQAVAMNELNENNQRGDRACPLTRPLLIAYTCYTPARILRIFQIDYLFRLPFADLKQALLRDIRSDVVQAACHAVLRTLPMVRLSKSLLALAMFQFRRASLATPCGPPHV